MKIIITGKNIELTEAIKSFVNSKIGLISKFLSQKEYDLAEVRVEVGLQSKHHKSGQIYYAEANLKLGRNLFRGQAEDFDLYVAVDKVRNELESQVKKIREKTRQSSRKARQNKK